MLYSQHQMVPPHVLCLYLVCQCKTPNGKQNREKRGGNKGDMFWHTTLINKDREKITKKLEILCCEAGSAWDCCMIPGGRMSQVLWDWRAKLWGAWVVKCLIRVLPPLKPEFVGQRGRTGERSCANKMSSCACRDKDPKNCRVPQCLLSQSCGDMLTSSFKESGA